MQFNSYMKRDRGVNAGAHSKMNVLLSVLRLVFGGVFIFSGFVKAIDPLGSTYKIQDYLTAFGGFFENFSVLALPAAIALSTLELLIGLALFFKIHVKLATWGGLLFMLFMTPLTLYIAIANPVSDCGCFGDAVVISNTATFVKNLFLLAVILILFVNRNRQHALFTPGIEWGVLLLFAVAAVGVSVHCYRHLPWIDFRPYKVGVNMPESMVVPEGYPQDEYAITFVYEKDGVQKEFTLENYPKNDSTWTFVDQKSVLVKQGYVPPIHDFSITDANFDDITYDVLDYEGYTILAVMYDLQKTNMRQAEKLNALYQTAKEKEYMFYALTGSESTLVEEFVGKTGAEYPFCGTDPITLKTIIRANPGIVLLKDGVVVGKWNMRDVKEKKIFR